MAIISRRLGALPIPLARRPSNSAFAEAAPAFAKSDPNPTAAPSTLTLVRLPFSIRGAGPYLALPALVLAALIVAVDALGQPFAQPRQPHGCGSKPPAKSYYMPDRAAERVVSVAKASAAKVHITILTQAVAEKDDENATHTCEIYVFVPAFFAVYRDQPTLLSFRNYQSDDDHDFLLFGPDSKPLMFMMLPALRETSYLFTFHKEGLYNFQCTLHQPEMNGQILVLPPPKEASGGRQSGMRSRRPFSIALARLH